MKADLHTYNKEHLYHLFRHSVDLIPEQEGSQTGEDFTKYVIVWGNVSFHCTNIIRQCLVTHNRMLMGFLSPYSPFFNPTEKLSQHGDGKDLNSSYIQMTLLTAMDAACHKITTEACRGWTRHKKLFSCCITRKKILVVMWKKRFVCQQTERSGGIGRLFCSSYSTACTVILKEIVQQYASILAFYSLWSAMMCFPFCFTMICMSKKSSNQFPTIIVFNNCHQKCSHSFLQNILQSTFLYWGR